ncbi:MAG TPA: hypothetical protein VJT71_01860 [Pyrinomonadaceae bacterium]|nr:hypothetical protein [Pyrinomonadaceae bacterium]
MTPIHSALSFLMHVKWFAPFNVHAMPKPVGEVLNGTFIKFFLVSALLIAIFFFTDRTIYRRGLLSALDARLRKLDDFSILILRLAAAVFLISVWAWYMAYGTSFYVTPELRTTARFVPWFQLALAICALVRPALPVVGIGLLLLFCLAVRSYGVFHLLDYMIFLGLGYFFTVANIERGNWRKSGFIVLYAATGITLLWAAMEKFGYPEWSYELLSAHSDMLLGMTPQTYMLLAGFMEFGLAFVLLGAASIAGRLVALGLQGIFMLAIFKFGMLDAIGHLMIIAILLVLFVRGPTSAREILVLKEKSIWMETYFMTGLYFLAFVLIFIAYYGLHAVFYRA